jgi:class 3 adenylate cyclase
MQNGMIERNAGLPPERRIEFRVGIHLGDVVEESDGDLMGDTVNIAARLEGIANPGGICLSEDAYRQVRDRSLTCPSAQELPVMVQNAVSTVPGVGKVDVSVAICCLSFLTNIISPGSS